MEAEGLMPSERIPLGKFVRFPGKGKADNNRAGWCILSYNGLWGAFGDFSSNMHKTWTADGNRFLTDEEAKSSYEKHVEEAQKILLARNQYAAEQANRVWKKSVYAKQHPYLTKKDVNAYGIKQSKDNLLIPVKNETGAIVSWLFIDPDGNKRFLSGGKKRGCYCTIGEITSLSDELVICLTEGWSTGSTVYESTGIPTVIAFDVGNLSIVAQTIHDQYPKATLIICADDDFSSEENVGVVSAQKAASLVGAVIVIPDFSGVDRADETDFNDLAKVANKEVVKEQIIKPLMESRSKKASSIQKKFQISEDSIYYLSSIDETWVRLCTRIDVVAKCRDKDSNSWGRLLTWRDDDKILHQFVMPMAMLSDASELHKKLLNEGVTFYDSKNGRAKLVEYIQCAEPSKTCRITDTIGWYGSVFCLPNRSFGNNDSEKIICVSYQANHYEEKGSLKDWQNTVVKFCVGNIRLTLLIAAAFAAIFLEPLDRESFGIHLYGESSKGKSTVLLTTASIFGGRKYIQQFRTTANALENLAKMANNTLLIIDELGQLNPLDAENVFYMLANGRGKARQKRDSSLRPLAEWRLIFVSAGEVSLEDHIALVGKQVKAGQTVRLLNIPASVDDENGLFENIHGFETSLEFVKHLQKATQENYGSPVVAFLEKITQEKYMTKCIAFLRARIQAFIDKYCPESCSSQVSRAFSHFGFIAASGELITRLGISGWPKEEAEKNVLKCALDWLDTRGGLGDAEEKAILKQVKGIFERYGESKFDDLSESFSMNPKKPLIDSVLKRTLTITRNLLC